MKLGSLEGIELGSLDTDGLAEGWALGSELIVGDMLG